MDQTGRSLTDEQRERVASVAGSILLAAERRANAHRLADAIEKAAEAYRDAPSRAELRRLERAAQEAQEKWEAAKAEAASMKSAAEILDEAAEMLLGIKHYDVRNDAHRKHLRIALRAMQPVGKEEAADQVVDRALQIALERDAAARVQG
jgi:hypothetical protein